MAHDQPAASPTTERVLANIRSARAAVEQLLSRLDEPALTRPGPGGGWSIKDHLAHLTAWRRMVLGLLDGQPRHLGLQVDPVTYAQGEDAINAALESRARRQPLSQVLAEFRQVYDTLETRLAAFDEAAWRQPYPLDPPPEDPRLGSIEGNTFEHDLEHLAWIEQALRQRT
jgi:uncharacterized protein (TIGR03083 family)